MSVEDRAAAVSYRISLILTILGLAFLSILFVMSLLISVGYLGPSLGPEGGAIEGAVDLLLRVIVRVVPLSVGLAAASIMLGKGLATLLRIRGGKEEAK